MPKFSDDFLQELKSRIDILDVVSKRVQLRKAGKEYTGLCPFHSEKSPSFTVSPHKQFYHCFGCGAHGDAIGFLVDGEGMDFVDAVETLAQSTGLALPVQVPDSEQEKAAKAQKDGLLDVLEAAKEHFRSQLRGADSAVAYAKSRGITGVTAKHWQLGYADNNIASALSRFSKSLLIEAGLLAVNEETGEVYDKFRQRLMFPIHDEKGRVIGFGGRVLNDSKPKYLNSPESSVFIKGNELYGLHFAKQAIRQGRVAVVLEGYMDVVMLQQYGEDRAVAALGTSLTEEQVARLFRMCDEIVLCFDGDNAGRAAATRAAHLVLAALKDGKTARFVTLPSKHDPDSFVQEFGIDGWRAYLESEGVPLSLKITAMLCEGRDVALPEHKAKIAKEAEGLLASMVEAPRFRDALMAHIESQIGMRLRRQNITANAGRRGAAPVLTGDQRKTLEGTAEKQGFYTMLALLCGLDKGAVDRVPGELMDDYASLAASWFAIAPDDFEGRLAAVDAMVASPLKLLLRTAVVRADEKTRHLKQDALGREVEALLNAMSRSVMRKQKREQIETLFGGE